MTDNISADQPDAPAVAPPEATKAAPWPLNDILLGLLILMVFAACGLAAHHSKALHYRPWLAAPVAFFGQLFLFASLFFYAFAVTRKRGTWPLLSPLQPSIIFQESIIGITCVLLIGLIVGPAVKLVEVLFNIQRSMDPMLQWLQHAHNSYLALTILIMAITIGPVVEELFFRGFLYNALKTRLPLWVAAVAQAVIFSLLHNYNLLNTFAVFLLGIAFALVYEFRKNLLSPVLTHVFFNAIWAVPLLVLFFQNHHVPAATWAEAKTSPVWLLSADREKIERQQDGMAQLNYAVATWGHKGSKQWKKLAVAYAAVPYYFPHDRAACANANLGLVEIYEKFLRDYRRAIVEADGLAARYPDQTEQYAAAMTKQGHAYLQLRDSAGAERAFQAALGLCSGYPAICQSAQEGIKWIRYLEDGE